MNGPITLRQVGAESVFDAARRQIAEWEKTEPATDHIVLILDTAKEVVVSAVGPDMKPSEAAGLCFTAARMAVE